MTIDCENLAEHGGGCAVRQNTIYVACLLFHSLIQKVARQVHAKYCVLRQFNWAFLKQANADVAPCLTGPCVFLSAFVQLCQWLSEPEVNIFHSHSLVCWRVAVPESWSNWEDHRRIHCICSQVDLGRCVPIPFLLTECQTNLGIHHGKDMHWSPSNKQMKPIYLNCLRTLQRTGSVADPFCEMHDCENNCQCGRTTTLFLLYEICLKKEVKLVSVRAHHRINHF